MAEHEGGEKVEDGVSLCSAGSGLGFFSWKISLKTLKVFYSTSFPGSNLDQNQIENNDIMSAKTGSSGMGGKRVRKLNAESV